MLVPVLVLVLVLVLVQALAMLLATGTVTATIVTKRTATKPCRHHSTSTPTSPSRLSTLCNVTTMPKRRVALVPFTTNATTCASSRCTAATAKLKGLLPRLVQFMVGLVVLAWRGLQERVPWQLLMLAMLATLGMGMRVPLQLL